MLVLGHFQADLCRAQCPVTAPTIRISQVNAAVSAVGTFCRGEQVQLNAMTAQANVRYQWKRDGNNIAGATRPTLVVDQSGLYTVSIESAACPNPLTSTPIIITTQDCTPTGRVRIRGGALEGDINDNLRIFRTANIRLTLYAYATEQNQYPLSVAAYIYRKRDNTLVRTISLERSSRIEGVWAGVPACGNDSTRLQDIYYFYNLPYEPAVFNDPDGYYMTTAPVCCREVSNNFPNGNDMVHYLEFSAHSTYNPNQDNAVLVPEMYLPFRMEACAGRPFLARNYIDPSSANIKTARYSFAPPLSSQNTPPRYQATAMAPGYTFTNFTGNTTTNGFTINATTGVISGTPERPGRYTYVVRAEVFQGTNIVGEIRQEINIEVKDCDNAKPTLFTSVLRDSTQQVSPSFCRGQSLQLNARGVSAGGQLQWQRDGAAITGATATSLLVNQAGRYTLTVIKQGACPPLVLSDVLTITATSPTVSVSMIAPPACPDQPVLLDVATSSTVRSYEWLLNGSPVLSTTATTFATSRTGRYQVRLTDIAGCTALSNTLPVSNTLTPQTVQIIQGQRPGAALCRGTGQYLRAETSATVDRYDWLRDGTLLTDVTSVSLEPDLGGIYTLRITTAAGCTVLSNALTLPDPLPPPALQLQASGQTICPGQTALVQTIPNPTFTYQWVRNGQLITGANRFSYGLSQPGEYVVQVTDAVGCSVVAGPLSVSVSAGPNVQISGDRQVCQLATTPLTATGSTEITTYEWSVNGISTTANAATLLASQGGTYRVKVTDITGCTAISPDWLLTVIDQVSVVMATSTSVCANAPAITLQASPPDGVFSGLGVAGNRFEPAVAGPGIHPITYTLTGATTCQSGTAQQSLTVYALPNTTVAPPISLNKGSTVELTGPAGNGYQYRWEPPTGLSNPTIRNPIASPNESTTYQLRIRDVNGCEATGSFVVEVTRQLFFPNAFTPNGDGTNDVWELVGVKAFPDIDVTIFNRWGTVIFYSKGYEQPFAGIDTTGSPLARGLYTYLITYDTPRHTQRGTVMLIR